MLVSSSVYIDGIKYCPDMVVSVGSCSGLQEFMQIEKILTINTDIMFLCKPQIAWYIEHLRSYELCSLHSLQVVLPSELNDPFPLAAYNVRGQFCHIEVLYLLLSYILVCCFFFFFSF